MGSAGASVANGRRCHGDQANGFPQLAYIALQSSIVGLRVEIHLILGDGCSDRSLKADKQIEGTLKLGVSFLGWVEYRSPRRTVRVWQTNSRRVDGTQDLAVRQCGQHLGGGHQIGAPGNLMIVAES